MHRHTGLLAEPAPALQQGNAGFQTLRPHIGLQIDVVGAEPRHQLQHRFQVIDIGWVALRLPDHAVRAQERGDFGGEAGVDEADAGAVEAGVADHLELRQ